MMQEPESPRPDVEATHALSMIGEAGAEEEGGDDEEEEEKYAPPPLAGDRPQEVINALYADKCSLARELRKRDKDIRRLQARLEELERPVFYTGNNNTEQTINGEFHAINSTSITLLSAAHHARSASSAPPPSRPPSLPEPLHQTDTASIRRRYMALEKGPGVKQELLFASPHNLFKSTVVLAFEEDSPTFRRKLQAMDENVEGMRNHLSSLVAIIQKYIEAGNAFTSVGRRFASELMHLEGESWFTRLGDLAPALVRFGEAFDEIQNYTDVVLASFELTFLAPMREFVKREMKEVKEMKDVITRRHEDYIACLQRFLALKRGSDEALISARTSELIKVRREYELARFDLVNNLNMLETKKKFQLVERVLCALYAYLGFFHQGHTELANLEPSMRDLQHQLHLSRREFAKDSRIGEAKRRQLEVHLSSALKGIQAQLALDDWGAMFDPPDATSNANNQQPPAPPAATPQPEEASVSPAPVPAPVPHSLSRERRSGSLLQAMADYVAHRTTSHAHGHVSGPGTIKEGSSSSFSRTDTPQSQNNEPTTAEGALTLQPDKHHDAQTRSDNAVSPVRFLPSTKQGYLWKRSNNIRKDWKRRFFCIKGGKLSYFRDHDPIGPPRGEICDLMLSTVRECQRPGDPRFSFEILSPGQRVYMLQAENEEDYKDWIKAIRSQTETLLVAGLDPGTQQQQHNKDATNLNNDFLERLRRGNPTCADCQATAPEWASINFGIMICIECSGIHRSLGVHISKVRSLRLDKWSKTLRLLMDAMGNERFNSVFEANVPPNRSKPGAAAAREERECWIRDKYLRHVFLSTLEADGSEQAHDLSPHQRLYDAAQSNTIIEVVRALALGGDTNWINEAARGRTPVHAACEKGYLICLELLFQNGGNLDVSDVDEVSPLDLAMKTGNNALIAYVLGKLERAQL